MKQHVDAKSALMEGGNRSSQAAKVNRKESQESLHAKSESSWEAEGGGDSDVNASENRD